MWTDPERKLILDLYDQGKKSREIAEVVNRSAGSVRVEISRLRPVAKMTHEMQQRVPVWSAEEVEVLLKLRDQGLTPSEMEEHLSGRTRDAIRTRLKRLAQGKPLVGRARGVAGHLSQQKPKGPAIVQDGPDRRADNGAPSNLRRPQRYRALGFNFSSPKLPLDVDRLELSAFFTLAASDVWSVADDLDLCRSLLLGENRNEVLQRFARRLPVTAQDVLERFALLTAPIRDQRGYCDLDGVAPFLEVLSQEASA